MQAIYTQRHCRKAIHRGLSGSQSPIANRKCPASTLLVQPVNFGLQLVQPFEDFGFFGFNFLFLGTHEERGHQPGQPPKQAHARNHQRHAQ